MNYLWCINQEDQTGNLATVKFLLIKHGGLWLVPKQIVQGLTGILVRGEKDADITEEEPYKLAKIVQEAGNKHVKVRQLQDAAHDCMDNPDQMMQEIKDMFVKFSKGSI